MTWFWADWVPIRHRLSLVYVFLGLWVCLVPFLTVYALRHSHRAAVVSPEKIVVQDPQLAAIQGALPGERILHHAVHNCDLAQVQVREGGAPHIILLLNCGQGYKVVSYQ